MSNPFVSDPSLGTLTALGITTPTILTTSGVSMPALVAAVSVIVAGTTAGTINDASTVGAAAASNQIASIPNTVGVTRLTFACQNGLVVSPGTGQTLAVSYSK